MISIKSITIESEISIFIDGFNRGSSKRNIDELRDYHIRGIYSDGLLLGGYAINIKPPYRYITDIPVEHRANLEILRNNPTIAEVSTLWVRDNAPNYIRAFVYNLSVIDAAIKRPDYVMGASYVDAYRIVQMRALPNLLWSGKAKIQGRERSVFYFYGTPFQCLYRLPYATLLGWYDRAKKAWNKRTVAAKR